ncbi:MAG: hypothetical protein KAT16_02330 [Candidatus Heimdallarchaeota archaeon]|nr:hypothetical protein [Candidatus Heimdallarchaeota archaeon]
MSFFKRRRVRKFAEQAVVQQSEFYVFGSNNFAEAFIEQLILIGAKNKVSLIADKKLAWIEEAKEHINVLYEEILEEYSKRNLYETIGFHIAKKVIILHEDPVIIQDIMSYVTGSDLKVIILAQFAPPFVKYLAGQKPGQIFIVNNLFQIVRELYEKMDLSLGKPHVISIPVPQKLTSRPLMEIKIPKVRLLRILREDYKKKLLPLDVPIQENDRLLLYLEDYQESLKNLVDFLGNL